MDSYRIELTKPAVRALRGLERTLQVRIKNKINKLATEPRPPGSKKLAGRDDVWRIHLSDYRVLYTIDDGRVLILVLGTGHRKEVYR